MGNIVHLIRHADADPRSSWSQPDAARPLSKLGRAQAMALADVEIAPGTPIYSSPAVRCVGTVTPLAGRVGVEVVPDDRLKEGADPFTAVEWITGATADETVLCGHGDLLPAVLGMLGARGMTLDGPNACQKGSIWTCLIEDGQPRHATYRPPPSV